MGGDIVEVSPAYDGTGETTALAGAQVVYEMLTSMVKRGLVERGEDKTLEKPRSRQKILGTGKKSASKVDVSKDEL